MEQQQEPQQTAKPPITPEGIEQMVRVTAGGTLPFTPDEVRMIWDSTPAITAPADFERFLYACSRQGLNPMLNEVHMEYRNDKKSPRGVKMAIVTHVDAYRRKGFGLVEGNKQTHGVDPDLGFWVETEIWLKGHARPFTARAHYNEYVQGYGKGNEFSPSEMWKKAYIMVGKCSESLAFRKAGVLVGTLSEDELAFEGAPIDIVPITNGKAQTQFTVAELPKQAAPTPTPQSPAPVPMAQSAPLAAPTPTLAPAPAPVVATPPVAPAPAPNPFAMPATTPVAAPRQTAPPAGEVELSADMMNAKLNMINTLSGTDRKAYNRFAMGFFGFSDPKQLPTASKAKHAEAMDKCQVFLSDPGNAEQNKILYRTVPDLCGAYLAGKGPRPALASTSPQEIAARFKWDMPLATAAAALVDQWHRELNGYTLNDFVGYLQSNGFQGGEHAELLAFFRVAMKTREAHYLCKIKAKSPSVGGIDNLVLMLETQLGVAIENADPTVLKTLLEQAASL